MNKKAILKQHKTNSWEEEDVKRGRKLASEGKMGHAEALFDDAHGSYNWRGGNDGFEQKLHGDDHQLDVMSETPVMSVAANKVNRHSAGRSKFMQAKEAPLPAKKAEKVPSPYPENTVIDRPRTNAANLEITKDNQAVSASNAYGKAEAHRVNTAADIEFAKDKAAAEAERRRQIAANKREKQRVSIR